MGLGKQPHTEARRERFRELLKDNAKVKDAEARKRELRRGSRKGR